MRVRNLIALAASAALTLGLGLTAGPVHAAPGDPGDEHRRIVNFWTKERVAKAKPRDFERQADGSFKPVAKPSKPGGGGSTSGVLGADWTRGGAVQKATGKVLFAMVGGYYLCSASVVEDSSNDTSTVLTAAHCAYDAANGEFATNWMFIPDYDSNPVSLASSTFCDQTAYGCWTAQALTVAGGYANAGGFNDQAVLHDYAFATVGDGGKPGAEPQLDTTVGTQAIDFDAPAIGMSAWLFGYPASGKYRGDRLIYSKGQLGRDTLMANQTYRVASNMTPGCSGGPWFQPFNDGMGVGTGTLISVNSYSYSGSSYLHGPKFNAETESLYDEADGAAANQIVP